MPDLVFVRYKAVIRAPDFKEGDPPDEYPAPKLENLLELCADALADGYGASIYGATSHDADAQWHLIP